MRAETWNRNDYLRSFIFYSGFHPKLLNLTNKDESTSIIFGKIILKMDPIKDLPKEEDFILINREEKRRSNAFFKTFNYSKD